MLADAVAARPQFNCGYDGQKGRARNRRGTNDFAVCLSSISAAYIKCPPSCTYEMHAHTEIVHISVYVFIYVIYMYESISAQASPKILQCYKSEIITAV